MKYLKSATAVTALVLSASVNAVTLTFDDHPNVSQDTYGAIGTYNGFVFGASNDSNRMDWIDTVDSVWGLGSVSGDFTMLNNYGGYAIITDENSADFTFDGLWARRWGGGDTTYSGYIFGYNNGELVWQIDTAINDSFRFYGAQAGLIDELRLDLRDNYLIDDLSLNGVSAVPVPAAVWLFGSGLIGLVGFARRKKA